MKRASANACQGKYKGWCNGKDIKAVIVRVVDTASGQWRNTFPGTPILWCAGCRQLNQGGFKYAKKD